MRKICILLICASLVMASGPFLNAQDLSKELILYLGDSQRLDVNMPYRIAIGKPDIADVSSVSDTEIILVGKKQGATTLVFWDSYGQHDFRVRVFARDMSDIKQRVDDILKALEIRSVYSRTLDSEAKVMLLGQLKSTQDRERLFVALGGLRSEIVDLIKIKEEETVVEIDVQVLELNEDATNTLGIEWPGSITFTEKGSLGIADAGTKWSSLFATLNASRTAFSATLNLLIQENKARILSRPRLVCQSGKEAELLVGGEKPVLTTSVTSGGGEGTDVEYKEYGIKLKIKPTVTEEDRIKLALNIEVSDVETAVVLGADSSPTALAFPLTKHLANTELYVNGGETVAIGGLIKHKKEEELRRVPWLSNVPFLGMFFRKKETKIGGGAGESGDKELFITLTPTILKEVARKTSVDADTDEGKKIMPVYEFDRLKSQGIDPDLQVYVRMIQNKISQAVYYPREAKDAGWRGVLKLSILLTADGSLKDLIVSQSSGYKILDDAGEDAVRKTAPFPPLPAQLKLEQLRIEMPIIYHRD